MSRRSLEAEQPIMASSLASKRASKRYSTFSASPSFGSSIDILEATGRSYQNQPSSLNITAAAGMAEIKKMTAGLDRLENKHLSEQRYVPTQKKTDEISKLNLGAKLDRALQRRMANQDATLSSKRMSYLGTKKVNTLPTFNEKTDLKI